MRKTTKQFTGGSKIRIVGGTITKITGGDHKMWAENITFNAGGQIIMNGAEKGVSFGEYVPIQDVYTTHPNVEKVEFVDEKGNILNQNTKDFYYGRKLKIRVTTKNAKKGDLLDVVLKGITKSKNQKFDLMNSSSYRWRSKPIIDNQYETPLFELNPNWYSDDFEYYDYNDHKTKIKEEDLNEFYVHAVVDKSNVYLPVKGERLKPISYKRNYEELIGLFHTDNSGTKDLLTNYENKFIDSVEDFKTIVDDFSVYINEDNRDLTIDQIRAKVILSAKKLWNEAVWQVQGHNLTTKSKDPKTGKETTKTTKVPALLDDRPLYWARLAMQVILKRHPIFEKDINLETSIVKKGTELEKIIQLFEEKSRNYTGIDFSKAPTSKKKLLISGFDPFVLNPEKNGNILQSNPSGVNALSLHGKTIGGYFIQTFIYPVRYKDFDEFKNGKGVVETFFQPFIGEADMIMTVSQGGPFRFDVDRFPCKNRGGFMDNMFWGNAANGYNQENFKQLTDGKEFYETTLPFERMVPNKNNPTDIFWVYFNQTFLAIGDEYVIDNEEGIKLTKKLSEIQSLKSIEGSGSNYLSNEIFYRVAKMRTEQRPTLKTGHLHIPLIQSKQTYTVRNNKTTIDINPKIEELIKQIVKIISKI